VKEVLTDWAKRVRMVDTDNPITYYDLEQLSPGVYYQLEVRAMNDAGYSEPNSEFVFSTVDGNVVSMLSPLPSSVDFKLSLQLSHSTRSSSLVMLTLPPISSSL
jgi:hypothetical protein